MNGTGAPEQQKRGKARQDGADVPKPHVHRRKRHRHSVTVNPGNDPARAHAAAHLRPNVTAATLICAYGQRKGRYALDADALVSELKKHEEAVNSGDLSRAEAMLIAQAHALDSLFGTLARAAAVQTCLQRYQTLLQLAFKAQGQCRATLQTLVEVKYPKQTHFVRQQNVAVNQQVNNGPSVNSRARGTALNPTNELLEVPSSERLEFDAASSPSAPDSPLATVDKVDRPQNPGWKKSRSNERL
jgi:hypothetical protein